MREYCTTNKYLVGTCRTRTGCTIVKPTSEQTLLGRGPYMSINMQSCLKSYHMRRKGGQTVIVVALQHKSWMCMDMVVVQMPTYHDHYYHVCALQAEARLRPTSWKGRPMLTRSLRTRRLSEKVGKTRAGTQAEIQPFTKQADARCNHGSCRSLGSRHVPSRFCFSCRCDNLHLMPNKIYPCVWWGILAIRPINTPANGFDFHPREAECRVTLHSHSQTIWASGCRGDGSTQTHTHGAPGAGVNPQAPFCDRAQYDPAPPRAPLFHQSLLCQALKQPTLGGRTRAILHGRFLDDVNPSVSPLIIPDSFSQSVATCITKS